MLKEVEVEVEQQEQNYNFEKVYSELNEIKCMLNSLRDDMREVLDKEVQLKGLIEINQRLIHEQLGTPNASEVVKSQKNVVDEKKKKEESGKKRKNVLIEVDGDNLKISGNTFDARVYIKQMNGAKWDGPTTSWLVPTDSLTELTQKFKENRIDFETTVTVPMQKESLSMFRNA